MLRLNNTVRFTAQEVDELQTIGLQFAHVRSASDIEQEVTRWVNRLADERFSLLEKIAQEISREGGAEGPSQTSER
jgi:hypothetical protein